MKNRKNKLISFFLIVTMLLCQSLSIFAADTSVPDTNSLVQSLSTYTRDSSTVLNSTSIVLNETRDKNPSENNFAADAAGIPYPFGQITFSTYTDLRTITIHVETIDSITPIISFGAMLTVKDYYGNITSSQSIGGATLFYDHTWTFTIPITSTVEETIILSNINVIYNLKSYQPNNLTLTRTNQIGGSYNSILNSMGGERHHLIASEVISSATVYKYNSQKVVTGTVTSGTAPCILMTPEDHKRTASWGSSTSAQNYRNNQLALINQGKYISALDNDINDIRAKFGNKYDDAIAQMWSYVLFDLYWYK